MISIALAEALYPSGRIAGLDIVSGEGHGFFCMDGVSGAGGARRIRPPGAVDRQPSTHLRVRRAAIAMPQRSI